MWNSEINQYPTELPKAQQIFFYIKGLHGNIEPAVARHIYIYIYNAKKVYLAVSEGKFKKYNQLYIEDMSRKISKENLNYLRHDPFISFRAFGNLSHCQE